MTEKPAKTPEPEKPYEVDYLAIATEFHKCHDRITDISARVSTAQPRRNPTHEEAMDIGAAYAYIMIHLPAFVAEFRRLQAKEIMESFDISKFTPPKKP